MDRQAAGASIVVTLPAEIDMTNADQVAACSRITVAGAGSRAGISGY